MAATEPIEDLNTYKLTTDCKEETNVWTAYLIQCETVKNNQGNPHESNPNATIFVLSNLANQKITTPVTPQGNEEQQNSPNVIAPTKRSDRIAARKARDLHQQTAYGQGVSSKQNNATMPVSSNAPGDTVGDHTVNHNAD